jgi:hypothetical protein
VNLLGKAHFDQWSSPDCSGGSIAANTFSRDQCFAQVADQDSIFASSFSCESSFVPEGEWYSTVSYTDSACANMFMASRLRNKYCLNLGGYSMMIDYPEEINYNWPYDVGTDCTSTGVVVDLSLTANQCLKGGFGTVQATKSFFSN